MADYLTYLKAEVQTKLGGASGALYAELGASGLAQAVQDAIRAYSQRRPRRRRLNNGSGLTLVAGTDSYTLPADFIRWEPETWAKATEVAVAPIRVYDHLGYGRVDTTAVTGMLEDSLQDPAITNGPTYTVYEGNPPTLVIDPAPQAAGTLKADYFGLHSITDTAGEVAGECTVPLSDWSLLVQRGWYEGFHQVIKARAINAVRFGAADGRRADYVTTGELERAAARLLQEWEDAMNRPIGVLG